MRTARRQRHVFVDPYWSNPNHAIIDPYSSSAQLDTETWQSVDDNGRLTHVPGLRTLVGSFSTPQMLSMETPRWLLIDGVAVCKVKVVSFHVYSHELPAYGWVSDGEVHL